MTLTHIIPSLRSSVPNPISQDLWPEFTTTTITDVTVAGVSLVRLADWCGTPCVHTAAAVIPNSGGMPSPTDVTSVIVTRVLEVSAAGDGTIDAWVDARIADSHTVVSEARMIGRVSLARDAGVRHTAVQRCFVMSTPTVTISYVTAIPICPGRRRRVADDALLES